MEIEAKVRHVLQETVRQKSAVYFAGDGLDITFQTRIVALDAQHLVLENHVDPAFIKRLWASAAFYLQCHMVRFRAERVETDGEHILFPIERNSLVEETRQSERFPFAAEERVSCELINPVDGETRLVKAVMDMSAAGLSIRTAPESLLFEPGLLFPALRVLIDGQVYAQAAGRVVYCRKVIDLKGHLRLQVGIKFEEVSS